MDRTNSSSGLPRLTSTYNLRNVSSSSSLAEASPRPVSTTQLPTLRRKPSQRIISREPAPRAQAAGSAGNGLGHERAPKVILGLSRKPSVPLRSTASISRATRNTNTLSAKPTITNTTKITGALPGPSSQESSRPGQVGPPQPLSAPGKPLQRALLPTRSMLQLPSLSSHLEHPSQPFSTPTPAGSKLRVSPRAHGRIQARPQLQFRPRQSPLAAKRAVSSTQERAVSGSRYAVATAENSMNASSSTKTASTQGSSGSAGSRTGKTTVGLAIEHLAPTSKKASPTIESVNQEPPPSPQRPVRTSSPALVPTPLPKTSLFTPARALRPLPKYVTETPLLPRLASQPWPRTTEGLIKDVRMSFGEEGEEEGNLTWTSPVEKLPPSPPPPSTSPPPSPILALRARIAELEVANGALEKERNDLKGEAERAEVEGKRKVWSDIAKRAEEALEEEEALLRMIQLAKALIQR